MRLIKKLLAFCFLGFGIPFSILIFLEMMNPKAAPEDKENAVAALIIFTIPSTVVGGWLSWSLVQQKKREQILLIESEQKRIRLVFLELIENNSGKITVLQLAKNAEISTQLAKQYLDEKDLELSADFEVNENGNFSYRFPL
ncbi:hypothetical protein [Nostoc sp. FACHB-145]|uniref:hypothetical protein n=1 Tax=Nostoc sp. FACHB-145 TaxID=2692836 RepID=UPI001682C247|nr:hypothetical protein [Nostoc sp. FACHB-145]MBD2471567.1 hypothetical protein [Nostoc sp. FACHB-145]